MTTLYAAPSGLKAAALVMLASALAAGCSSSGNGILSASAEMEKSPTAGPVATPTAETTATPTAGTVAARPLPKKVPNDPSVRRNIVQTGCAAVAGGWGAEGTARNPGKKPVTYKIVVFFTTTKATTLDSAQTLVKVPPGKTVGWSAEKKFKAEQQMLCPMPGISVVDHFGREG